MDNVTNNALNNTNMYSVSYFNCTVVIMGSYNKCDWECDIPCYIIIASPVLTQS